MYDIWYMIYDMWYVICDTLYVICDMWYVICDMWYVICDMWYVIYDTWYMIYHVSYMIYIYPFFCCVFPYYFFLYCFFMLQLLLNKSKKKYSFWLDISRARETGWRIGSPTIQQGKISVSVSPSTSDKKIRHHSCHESVSFYF